MTKPLLVPNDMAEAIAAYLCSQGHDAATAPETQTQSMITIGPRCVVIEDDGEADARAIVNAIMGKARAGDTEAAEWLEERGVVKLPTCADPEGEAAGDPPVTGATY